MNQLSKKRNQFRLEIRRQQYNKMFFSMRTTMLQINCSESFISHYTHLIQQNLCASQIIASMKKDIKLCQGSIKSILSQAAMHILMTKKFQFWQTAQIQDVSQLFSIMFPCLEQDMKKLKYWQPFIELLTAAIIGRWLHKELIDEELYQTVIEMYNFASDYEEYYYKTFQEQIQRVLMQTQHLENDLTISVLMLALKLTPSNLLNTKSKRLLFQIAKRTYYRNSQISNSWRQDQLKINIEFVLLVLQKKGIELQEKQMFWEIIEKINLNKQNYKQILQLLKFQSQQNQWLNYDQSIKTLRIVYPLLKSSQDKCSFLKTIRNIIINELLNHQTIYSIYVQFFQSKLEVYLQHRSLIGIFSQIVYYFTYPSQIPFQQELISCVQSLMLYHKNKLKEKTKKRFICWLCSKQKFQLNTLASILTEEEVCEFYEDLENNQRDTSFEV